MCTACTNCMCTACALHVHCMCTACALHVHCMYTVHGMCTVHGMYAASIYSFSPLSLLQARDVAHYTKVLTSRTGSTDNHATSGLKFKAPCLLQLAYYSY